MLEIVEKCKILGELYERFRGESGDFEEFLSMNDIGLPLAYFAKEGMVTLSDDALRYIDATWRDLMNLISAGEADEFDSIDAIIFRFYYYPIVWRITESIDDNGDLVYLTKPNNGYTLREFYSTFFPQELIVDESGNEASTLPDDAFIQYENLTDAINEIIGNNQSIEYIPKQSNEISLEATIEISSDSIMLSWGEEPKREERFIENTEEGLTYALNDALDRNFDSIQILYCREREVLEDDDQDEDDDE